MNISELNLTELESKVLESFIGGENWAEEAKGYL